MLMIQLHAVCIRKFFPPFIQQVGIQLEKGVTIVIILISYNNNFAWESLRKDEREVKRVESLKNTWRMNEWMKKRRGRIRGELEEKDNRRKEDGIHMTRGCLGWERKEWATMREGERMRDDQDSQIIRSHLNENPRPTGSHSQMKRMTKIHA